MNSNNAFTEQQCPVCGEDKGTVLFKDLIHTCNVLKKSGLNIKNEDALSDILECKNCGHKYLSPVLNYEIIGNYYSVVESEYYDTVKINPHDRIPEDTKRYADLIEEKCSDSKTVLEIGSGMGFLLFQLKKKGFNCIGVEPSAFASSFSKKEFELDVVNGLLDFNTFPDKKFDIIVLSDVVEHINGINQMFDLIKHYMKPEGYVVILTGDSNSLYSKLCGRKWLYFFSWEHVSFFNKKSISYLFSKHALQMNYFKKVRHSGSYWMNLKTFLITFRSILANRLGLRNHKFFYMAFDHFFAIGKNQDKKG